MLSLDLQQTLVGIVQLASVVANELGSLTLNHLDKLGILVNQPIPKCLPVLTAIMLIICTPI